MGELRISKLKSIITKYEKIAIYGCGMLGKVLYDEFKLHSIKVDFFIETNKTKQHYDGINVYDLAEIADTLRQGDTLVFLGVTKQNIAELETNLNKLCINDYVYGRDYLRNVEISDYYNNKDIDFYCEEIKEWYLEKYNAQMSGVQFNRNRCKNRIVVCLNVLMPRHIKIIEALVKYGKNINVIVYPHGTTSSTMEEYSIMKHENVEVCYCDSFEEMFYLLIQENAYVIHLFNAWGNSSIASLLIKQSKYLPPIVFDQYDILTGCYIGIDKEELDKERYCLENASGICNRGYEIPFLKEHFKMNISENVIQFFEYYNENIADDEKSDLDEDLSLVYVGRVVMECDRVEDFEAVFVELAGKCMENKCHLHIYPSNYDDRMKHFFELVESNNVFLHLHQTLPLNQLLKEISQYDYGIYPISYNKYITFKDVKYTEEKVKYACTNKFIDYVQSGLPIIASIPQYFIKEFDDMVIPWFVEDYDFDYLRQNKKKMKEIVKKNREKFKMNNNIERLINLYDIVQKDK